MLKVFIFKSDARGMRYGMGSYLNHLIGSLSLQPDVSIIIVNLASEKCNEFQVEEINNNHKCIHIPKPIKGLTNSKDKYTLYAKKIPYLLSDFIEIDDEVIFHFNIPQMSECAASLKENYNYPIISVVHYAEWQLQLNGNKKKFDDLLLSPPENNPYLKLFLNEKKMYQLSDHIISVTGYMKSFLNKYYKIPFNKISIIRNGISTTQSQNIGKEEIKNQLNIYDFEKIILFSGRIDANKGIEFLIKAFENVIEKDKNVRLIIVGDGNLNDYFGLCANFWSKVTFTGFIPFSAVESLYKIADIGIIPSIFDYCPYAALEMMAYKIPLIVSDCDGLKEIFEDRYDSLIVNQTPDETGEIQINPEELSQKMLQLLEDNVLAEKLANNAFVKVQKHFTAQRMAKETLAIYRNALSIKKEMVPKNNSVLYESI